MHQGCTSFPSNKACKADRPSAVLVWQHHQSWFCGFWQVHFWPSAYPHRYVSVTFEKTLFYFNKGICMKTPEFTIAHPEEILIREDIVWSIPQTFDVLFSGHVEEDDDAYFYAIVAYTENEWWTYYLGMVFEQCVSDRLKQDDHKKRLESLRLNNKNLNFSVSLGVLKEKENRKITRKLIEGIEGLLTRQLHKSAAIFR